MNIPQRITVAAVATMFSAAVAADTQYTPDTRLHAACVTKLAEFEGFRPEVYACPLGFPTIGFGHRVQRDDDIPTPLDVETAYTMLWEDVAEAEAGARTVYRDFDGLPTPAKEALIHMAFQLGTTGLSKFANLKKQIALRNWPGAGAECMDSRWARQTPNRARYCAQLFGGIR